jgi:hypothetical protein
MAVTITNRASHLLIVPLNDGQALYLAPGETSRPVEERQVSGNEKVAKLSRGSLVWMGGPAEERDAKDAADGGTDGEGPRRKPRS